MRRVLAAACVLAGCAPLSPGARRLARVSELQDRAEALAAEGKPAEIAALLSQAETLLGQAPKAPDARLARAYKRLGDLHSLRGDDLQAERAYRAALGASSSPGRAGLMEVEHLRDLALLHQSRGRYPEAEPLYQRALVLAQGRSGTRGPQLSDRHLDLALLYQVWDRPKEAEAHYLQAAAAAEAALGPADPALAALLNNLALFYEARGRKADAERAYRRALEACRRAGDGARAQRQAVLDNFRDLLRRLGRIREAAEL